MPALLLALLMAAASTPPEATTGRPALLRPVVEAAARCSAAPQLVVAVTGFTPPKKGGHATLVVSLRTADGRRTELGQVGVFPEQAFTASLADAKRFGFALPKSALAGDPQVMVELKSDGGTGARATIAEARIGPAPQERC